MRPRARTQALLAVTLLALLAGTVPVNAHPVHDFGGDHRDALKGRAYTGLVSDPSPGGVPMEAMFDIRCEDGMAGIFPCHRVDLAAFLPLPDLEATFVNDIWGWQDPVTGMQLAIVGTFEGTAFVDVTDGTAPVYLGTLGSQVPGDFGNIWGDIRVYANTAYIGAEALDFTTYDPVAGTIEGFGVQVVDLTQFRGATGPIDIQLTNHIDDVTQSHNLSINEDTGRLYVVGSYAGLAASVSDCHTEPPEGLPVLNGSGGALIYDLTGDPHNPEFIGCVTTDVYNHDIQCVVYQGPDPDYQDREMCIGSDEFSVAIYDVTDGSAPVEVSRIGYLDVPPDWDEPFPPYYTHQGWLTADQRYFFLSDELDEVSGLSPERATYIWDLADLDDPQLIGVHTDGNTSIDHNLFVHDGLLYQANYTSGLWIYDAWKVEQGRVIMRGFFDVFPADDRTDFFGSWGNYPFFGDGKVIVSSSDEGLFVLQSRATSANKDVDKSRGNGQG